MHAEAGKIIFFYTCKAVQPSASICIGLKIVSFKTNCLLLLIIMAEVYYEGLMILACLKTSKKVVYSRDCVVQTFSYI